MRALESFSDEDFRRTMLRALRLLGIVSVVGALLLWWKLGWQSAALLAVGVDALDDCGDGSDGRGRYS